MPNATDALTARLENLASAIRARSTVQERLIGREDCATMRDYHVESLVAAFEAFRGAGGNPDQPVGFGWTGQYTELVQAGRLHRDRHDNHILQPPPVRSTGQVFSNSRLTNVGHDELGARRQSGCHWPCHVWAASQV